MATSRWHARPRVLVFLLTAIATLCAIPALSAHAGPPPTMTATPNPVIVPQGQTTGTYTLAWTMGDLAYDFYVSENGGAPVGPMSPPADGSTGVNINVGNVQTWKMFPKGSTEKPVRIVTVTAKHLDIACKSDCIKLAAVDPHGTFGHFHVIPTKKLPKLTAEVHLPGQSPLSSDSTTAGPLDWQPNLSHLKPDTFYNWSVTATDEAGNTQTKTGGFKTLRRKVVVNYNPITVIDDSDDLSGGDLKFWFGANGSMDTNAFGEVNVDSGNSTFPNHNTTRLNVPDTMGLKVVGQDNDCDIFDFCSLPFETPATGPVGHGSDSLSDWSTAATTVNTQIDGPGEAFTATKTFSTTSWELQFSVKATWTVSYF